MSPSLTQTFGARLRGKVDPEAAAQLRRLYDAIEAGNRKASEARCERLADLLDVDLEGER